MAFFPLAGKPDAKHRSKVGLLGHADTVDSLTLMAKEIMPWLKEYTQPKTAQNAAGVGDLARAVRVQIRLEL